ncbi:6-bladed beta-propeller [candidate division KSB1 bacterium]
MRITLVIVVIVIFALNCSNEGNEESGSLQEPIENVLTLQLSIGLDEDDEDFLLVQPVGICVNDSDYVFVTDENRIKIYDREGKGHTILGGSGQGPGEFTQIGDITINNSGIISATDFRTEAINVFDGNFSFDKRISFQTKKGIKELQAEKKLLTMNIGKVFYLNDEEQFIRVMGLLPPVEPYFIVPSLLLYDNQDTVIELLYYEPKNVVRINNGMGTIPFHGRFYSELLPDNSIIYTNSEIDNRINDDKHEYIIHLFSPETLNETEIIHEYVPEVIHDSVKVNYIERMKDLNISKEVTEFIVEEMKQRKHYSPVAGIKADLDRIFVFTNQLSDAGEFIVDIFDTMSKKYIQSAYFSVVPQVIKNEYAYSLYGGGKDVYRIEKYRINPRVYN